MNNYHSALIQNPPILIYGLDAAEPPGLGYLLLTNTTPILLTDNEFLQLA